MNAVKDLRFSKIGSGLLVFNKRSNKDVAHISKKREITYYGRVSKPVRAKITGFSERRK